MVAGPVANLIPKNLGEVDVELPLIFAIVLFFMLELVVGTLLIPTNAVVEPALDVVIPNAAFVA